MRHKYLTEERFEKFLNQDFAHLKYDVKFVKKLLWIILAVIIASLFTRFIG